MSGTVWYTIHNGSNTVSLQCLVEGTLLPPGGAVNAPCTLGGCVVSHTLTRGSSDITCNYKNWDIYAANISYNFFKDDLCQCKYDVKHLTIFQHQMSLCFCPHGEPSSNKCSDTLSAPSVCVHAHRLFANCVSKCNKETWKQNKKIATISLFQTQQIKM